MGIWKREDTSNLKMGLSTFYTRGVLINQIPARTQGGKKKENVLF
jgi:hypothetical protein